MESAAVFRSFSGHLQSVTHVKRFLEKHASIPFSRDASTRCLSLGVPVERQRLTISKSSRKASLKAAETTSALTSNAAPSESAPQGLSRAKSAQKSTFPNGFEELVLDVCDETDVAELKLKVSGFEMHLKRNIGSPAPVAPPPPPPATPPPAPSKPKMEVAPTSPQATPAKSTPKSTAPFSNISTKASKLAALEASGSNTSVLVSSPTVGLFRSGRTLKGKKQPPSCKEGDMIKEGQVIGFLDQFGSELPIKSNAAGEVLKVLYQDGEPVGYGDPLVAVLPSFHGIK